MKKRGSSAKKAGIFFADIKYEHVLRASSALSDAVPRTPVFTSQHINKRIGAEAFFKCENLQRSGSFKFRGAYAAIASLSDAQRRLGVIANSSVNHARAVAFASQMLNVPAMIVLPSGALASDIAAVRECGVEILLDEAGEDPKARVAELINKYGWTLVPSAGSQEVLAGQGSAVKELIEEVGLLHYLFVPVQEGGLLYGSAVSLAHLSPGCVIVGACRQGASPLPAYAERAQKIVTVSDAGAYEQMRLFWEQGNFMVEHLGCLGAAALFDRVVDVSGARVGVILSGGNVDASAFRRRIAGSGIRIIR